MEDNRNLLTNTVLLPPPACDGSVGRPRAEHTLSRADGPVPVPVPVPLALLSPDGAVHDAAMRCDEAES